MKRVTISLEDDDIALMDSLLEDFRKSPMQIKTRSQVISFSLRIVSLAFASKANPDAMKNAIENDDDKA